jgi:hypothetical protein
MPSNQNKKCLNCNKPLIGRADKKFCTDQCRNEFNNQLRAAGNNYVRNINHALGKNRRILEDMVMSAVSSPRENGRDEMVRVSKEKLMHLGFQFKYLTHSFTNKKGGTYFYCYDYGYLPLDGGEWVLIVKDERKENHK